MKNYTYIVGIDEVGRGPLAGPVMVAAFCVPEKSQKKVLEELEGITDSKKLTKKRREDYAAKIKSLEQDGLLKVSISAVSAKLIDQEGIVPAINSAVRSSLKKLNINPAEVFIYLDGGLRAPASYDQETVIKGDSKIWQIGAASVIAKVLRDRKMIEYAKKYPEYGFEKHKGYGTKLHRENIQKYGICDIHRKSWIKSQ
ncbi:MAG: ribonuclease HII [Candidatus Pacebacteria bacterium]|nr:ribonuclease HII [Candidatus Paceibacterota bacterium]